MLQFNRPIIMGRFLFSACLFNNLQKIIKLRFLQTKRNFPIIEIIYFVVK